MPLRIDFTDRHEHHPPAIKAYALEKAQKVARFFDGVNHIQIVLDRDAGKHRTEMIAAAPPNLRFVATAVEDSVTVAIDSAIDKIERQVVKAKERLKDHHPREHTRKPER